MDLFGEDTPQKEPQRRRKKNKSGSLIFNPCINSYGEGPAGAKCKTCKYLLYKHRTRRYYKCHFRYITSGPGSDHKINWPACGKYEKALENGQDEISRK
jgi:hypothetical protein